MRPALRMHEVMLCAALIALSAWLHSVCLPNTDNSWLLFCAQNMLHGATPYVDFIETNPPLIIYLYAVPVALAEWLSAPLYPVFIIVLHALFALVTTSAAHLTPNPRAWWLISIVILLVIPARDFGQREHVFIMLSWPLLTALLHQRIPTMTHSLAAAIGTAIKPYFMLLWLCTALAHMLNTRRWRPLRQPYLWVIAAVQLCYLVYLYCIERHYWQLATSKLAAGYGFYNNPIEDWIAQAGLVPLALIGFYALRRTLPLAPLVLLAAWCLAATFIAVLQMKGFPYHFYPLQAMLMLSAAWVYMHAPARMLRICTLLFALLLVLQPLLGIVRLADGRWDKPHSTLAALMHEHAHGQAVLPLSFDMLFPRHIMQAGATLPYPYAQLWPLVRLYHDAPLDASGMVQFNSPAQMGHAEKKLFAHIIRSVTQHPPALIAATDRDYYWYQTDHSLRFDFIGYLRQSEVFDALMKDYTLVQRVNTHSIDQPHWQSVYVRTTQPPLAPPK